MKGHRSFPPNLKTEKFIEATTKNLEKGRYMEKTEKQLEAIKKNFAKGGWKGTEKQLEHIQKIAHAPRTKKQKEVARRTFVKAQEKGRGIGGKAVWDKIRRGELSHPQKGKHWHLENGKRIYV